MPDSDILSVLVIGDPHFKVKNVIDGEDFINKCVEKAAELKPGIIVILGDVLDTHEIVHVQAHNLAHLFIERISEISHTYILIGNHDYINNTQYLTTAHIFNPYKKWDNVTIIDKPLAEEIDGYTLFFCPYVEPGRFVEALETTAEFGELWEMADCIFAHQEFKGCKMGAISSVNGDEWPESHPVVISGHIHESQVVGSNIFYPGSSMQHGYGDLSDKRIWNVSFGKESTDSDYFSIDKIDLGLRTKRIISIGIEDVDDFDIERTRNHDIKLSISGTPEQFKVFRMGDRYRSLVQNGVKFAYKPIIANEDTDIKFTRENLDYETVLKRVLENKSVDVQNAFETLFVEK